MSLLEGPTGALVLMSEVPLYPRTLGYLPGKSVGDPRGVGVFYERGTPVKEIPVEGER